MAALKFRVYYEGKMCYFGLLDICAEGAVVGSGDNCCDIRGLEVMQYTGLKDKNGKEIFEGDVLRLILNERLNDDRKRVGEVRYIGEEEDYGSCACFGIMYTVDGLSVRQFMSLDFSMTPYTHIRSLKVIGNIFENKELLT